jgi:predicted DNA-binding transcriptional regulator AlpA
MPEASTEKGSDLLMPEDVAKRLKISPETLAQWRSQGRGLPYVKLGRNLVRYEASALNTWIERHTVHNPEEPVGSRRRY